MDKYREIITNIYRTVKSMPASGHVADYIPALADANPESYGIAVAFPDGSVEGIGDWQTKFSIQSISKVFTLAMVMRHMGSELWAHVGREPSGSPFNSLVQLEHEQGIPRNPFINAGALVITDRILSLYQSPKQAILSFIRSVSGSEDIYFDKHVAESEYEHASRNMALAHFMKSFGNIQGSVETLIDVYCHQCSVSMTCAELARAFLFLTNRGVNPFDRQRILSISRAKRLSALMLTCGFYDESGDFAFRVGLPGKSGVGGGIAAIIPGKLSIAVWSPALNEFGNSVRGIDTLERFTTDLGISIF
ncbi:MAG: glutaminase [Muribaculaceae bacterium]|nr:glutaminase [Muribaculaceae bacterium]